MPPPTTFKRTDLSKNLFRLYRMTPCTTLFGELCLRIEWGRQGRRLRARSEIFQSTLELERRLLQLVKVRKQHGYVAA